MIYQSSSQEETARIAQNLAKRLEAGAIILMTGPLGAGKTTFVSSFAKELGVKKHIISPTFTLMRSYSLSEGKKLYHLDLYRLESPEDILGMGIEEILRDKENIVIIEWGERLGFLKLPKALLINISPTGETSRTIEITQVGS